MTTTAGELKIMKNIMNYKGSIHYALYDDPEFFQMNKVSFMEIKSRRVIAMVF